MVKLCFWKDVFENCKRCWKNYALILYNKYEKLETKKSSAEISHEGSNKELCNEGTKSRDVISKKSKSQLDLLDPWNESTNRDTTENSILKTLNSWNDFAKRDITDSDGKSVKEDFSIKSHRNTITPFTEVTG